MIGIVKEDAQADIAFKRVRDGKIALEYTDPTNISQDDLEARSQNRPVPRGQMWKLFWKQVPGIAYTVILLAVYVGILKGYETRSVSHRGKVTYNTLTTANLIALGLSFFGVLKTMAKVVRWRLVFQRPLDEREVNLILGADSLTNVFLLMCKSWRDNVYTVTAAAAGYLLFNFAAQVVVAMIQLNASMESGFNSSAIISSPGTVIVPKLDCFYRPNNDTCPTLNSSTPSTVAHAYGEAVDIYKESGCLYTGDVQDIEDRQECVYFRRDTGPQDIPEYAVRFVDYSPDDINNRMYPFLDTHRFITVNATNCRSLNATYNTHTVAGNLENNLTFPSGPNGSIDISVPRGDMGAKATDYIWHGSRDPRNESDVSDETCGPRCIYLYAVRDSWEGSQHYINTYQCEIHVSEVSNVTNELHLVPSNVARTAAAAIALTGEPHEGNLDLNVPPPQIKASIINWDQFHSYPEGADWAALPNETAFQVGGRMAKFAAAALGTLARRGPTAEAQGMVPQLGYMLSVKWPYVAGIAGSIAAAHVLLVFIMLSLVHRVVVPDDSALVVSRLLNKVTGGLPDRRRAGSDDTLLARSYFGGKASMSSNRHQSQAE